MVLKEIDKFSSKWKVVVALDDSKLFWMKRTMLNSVINRLKPLQFIGSYKFSSFHNLPIKGTVVTS